MKKIVKRRKPNRSVVGDVVIYFLLFLIALAMVFPLVFAVSSALKPLDELFLFPPKVFAQNPTMDNFQDLFVTMGKSWVTFSRYIFNTVFITVVGTAGHLIIASMGAFVLAKYEFPGSKLFFSIVVTALMFNGYVTAIPNYLIISKLGWIDTYWAIIVPAFAAPMGLFLMKQFMEGLPMSLVEAAMIDGEPMEDIYPDYYAECKTGMADTHYFLCTKPVEQQGSNLYLLGGKEDACLCIAADSERRYCTNRSGSSSNSGRYGCSDFNLCVV